jgi:hypothetical protein
MNTIGWKVVSRNADGTLGSAICRGLWARVYTVNQRVTGYAGTPVLAFSTRKAARSFKYYRSHRVFKALLENPWQRRYIARPWEPGSFEGFWASSNLAPHHAPDGTLACDAITLLEQA